MTGYYVAMRPARKRENTDKRIAAFTSKVLALGGSVSDRYINPTTGEVLFYVHIDEMQKAAIESWPMVYDVTLPPKCDLGA